MEGNRVGKGMRVEVAGGAEEDGPAVTERSDGQVQAGCVAIDEEGLRVVGVAAQIVDEPFLAAG